MLNKKKVVFTILIISFAVLIPVICIIMNNKYKSKMKNKEVSKINDIPNENTIQNIPTLEYNNEVPILCYHGVLDEAWGDKSIFTKVDEFEAQMKYLDEQGYTSLFVSEIAEANKYEKPIIITFDDGYKDVYENAFPILKKYNIKADLYVITAYLDGEVYLTTDMLKELAESPLIEIGSHTVNHAVLTKKNNEEIIKQLSESKRILEEITKTKVETIAYPTGAYNDNVINLTKEYYKYALSIEDGKEDPKNLNIYELRRIYMLRDYDIEKFKELIEN